VAQRAAAAGRSLLRLVASLVLVLTATGAARAQLQSAVPDSTLLRSETEYHRLAAGRQPLVLAHPFVDAASARVYVDGILWQPGRDYQLRSRSGLVVPLQPWSTDETADALVIVTYRFLPVPLSPRLDLHPMARAPAVAEGRTELVILEGTDTEGEAYGYGDLTVRGSKAVRVASGNQRELTVDQNLRLSVSGQLTRDISVEAFLSDDNLPVVPEGNTEELRDVDKVLVELRAPTWRATLGDFVARRAGTVYGNYRRKLQGFDLSVHPGRTFFELLAGSPRGRYRTLQIRGEESNQGPYFLGFGETGQNLLVVAGSEKVTLDGQRLRRGIDNDYIIDYVVGTITFSHNRLITSDSDIVVEYEEGDSPYSRTVIGGGAGVNFTVPVAAVGVGGIAVRVIQEADDPKRLRSGVLAPEDEEILRLAGDDPSAAIAPGAALAPESGGGDYDQTTQDGQQIYVFNPDGGDWIVVFFHLGAGLGDYALETLTATGRRVFVFRGDGQGAYRVGRPVPLPERKRIITATAAFGDSTGAFLRGEWNASDHDRNQVSDLDDDDNVGVAGELAFGSGVRKLRLAGRGIGSVTVAGSIESRDDAFTPFVLRKTRFSYQPWGLDERARRPGFLEQRDTESRLDGLYRLGTPTAGLELDGNWGKLLHGDGISADRLAAGGRWWLGGGRGSSRFDGAHSVDSIDPLDVKRRLQRHEASWILGPIVPGAHYDEQSWRDAVASGPAAGGYRLRRTGARLASAPGKPLRWLLEFERGLADSLYNNVWSLERDSRTSRASVTSPQLAGIRIDGSATVRSVARPGLPDQTTRLAKLNLTGHWNSIGSDWSFGYQVDNSRTEIFDRQIIFVGERQGDFDQSGRFVGRGQGAYNVITAGTDSLVATTRVAADLTWNQDFGFLGRDRLIGAWSSATRIGVIGNSRTDDVGALLRLDRDALFDPDDAIIGDVRLTQELTLLRHLRHLDLRLKYDFRQVLDRQFITNPEDRLDRLYQSVINWNLDTRNSLRVRLEHGAERRTTDDTNPTQRSYDAVVDLLETEWSLRPKAGDRIGVAGAYIRREDRVSTVRQTEYAVQPKARVLWAQRWSAQVNVRLAEVNSSGPTLLRPFFFPLPGRNIEGSVSLGWNPTRHLDVSLTYFARKQGERRWQHDLRLESTARF